MILRGRPQPGHTMPQLYQSCSCTRDTVKHFHSIFLVVILHPVPIVAQWKGLIAFLIVFLLFLLLNCMSRESKNGLDSWDKHCGLMICFVHQESLSMKPKYFISKTITWAPFMFACLCMQILSRACQILSFCYSEPSSCGDKMLFTYCVHICSRKELKIYKLGIKLLVCTTSSHARLEAVVTMLVLLMQSLIVGQTESWQAAHTGSSPSRKEPNVLCGP